VKSFEKIYKLIDEIEVESKEGLHDIMCVISNVILHSVAEFFKEISLDAVDRESRIKFASQIVADINKVVIPLHKKIDGISEDDDRYDFNGTSFAREIRAISEDLELHVKTTYKDGGRQIEASVGKKFEVDEKELDDEMKENLKKMMLATEIAKA
jgi:hypothetical protein